MLIVGIFAAGLGGLFLWLAKKQKATSTSMKQSSVSPIQKVQPDTQAEIYGKVVCQSPLQTPFSNQPCVYYEYEVEKEVWERDNDGRMETNWETVEEDKKQIPFYIDDGSGKIKINPDGATIEPRDLGEKRWQRGQRFNNSLLENIFSGLTNFNARVSERALMANENAYVFGYVTKTAEGYCMQKHDKKFLISYRTEEEVEKRTARSATIMKVLGIAGIILGIGLVIYSFT